MTIFNRLRSALPCERLGWSGEGLQAAVLVGLTDEPEPQVILVRRAQHLRLHPGEVAFPGGKREAEDDTPWATALREAEEEVGLTPKLVDSLSELPPLMTRSDFEVHPCIAKVPAVFEMVVDKGELDSVFKAPLRVFADSANYRLEKMSDSRGSAMVPHYQIDNDNIWGVTAAVLVHIVNVAMDAKLNLQRNWMVKP